MNWDEGFGWPKMGGGGGAGLRPKPRPPVEPVEVEPEPAPIVSEESAAPPQKIARLWNPKWGKDKAYFDEKAEASVDGDLPPEISHLTKVHFTVFAKLPDGTTERIDAKEGHLKGGKASVEFDLWTPKYRNKAGQAVKKAEYYFTAKHRDGEELKSGVLPVSIKLIARGLNAREMKRGVRGEDVFGWQKFLLRIREQSEFSGKVSKISLDGIFGFETHTATAAFQGQVGLEADGIVGPDTREEAELLGAIFTIVQNPGKTEATPQSVRQGKIPIFPPPPAPPPPLPPSELLGSSREESWTRLRAEPWCNSLKSRLETFSAVCQAVENGTGDYIFDEYSIVIEKMPKGVEPEALLMLLASDINGVIKNPDFDRINMFKRRHADTPTIGEIVDIDILGPFDGSVVLGELGRTLFIYQTIDFKGIGHHPENGAREFGFQIVEHKVVFYTRGVSRPSNYLFALGGPIPQKLGWTALMQGISNRINSWGGKSDFKTFSTIKEHRDD